MTELSIDVPPNWGDFKAFTTLRRQRAELVSSDVERMRVVVSIDHRASTLEVGGPTDRFMNEINGRAPEYVALVSWNGIWVMGIPGPSGHALFRARTAR